MKRKHSDAAADRPSAIATPKPRLALVAMFCAWPTFATAATITVCASGCNQTNVGTAIASANDGDTILVGAGSYTVSAAIFHNVTVQGAGAAQTTLNGAGLSVLSVATGATVQLRGVFVTGASEASPGALLNHGSLTITDCVIAGNSGAIENDGPILNVVRTTITDSTGTGLPEIVTKGSGATVAIIASTIANTRSTGGGGAIDIRGGLVTLLNSTVTGNSGGYGLIQFPLGVTPNGFTAPSVGSLTAENSTIVSTDPQVGNGTISVVGGSPSIAFVNSLILSPPGVRNCAGYFGPSTFLSLGHNLSTDNTCNLTASGDLVNNSKAMLGPLQVSAPGNTATFALLPGSAAIDSGFCSISFVDQRGIARPQGPACDIGAFEVQLPVAVNDAYSTGAGQALRVPAPGVLANDTSADVSEVRLSVFSATATANGSLILATDGSIQYAPNAGFTGQDTFTYRAYDGIRASAPATVTINVTPANRPPAAQNDTYTVLEGQKLSVTAARGVLANDRDPDGDPITAIPVAKPLSGHFDYFNADGSFSYVPNPGFNGVDSFTYQAYDGRALSNIATVTLTVMPNFGTITIAVASQPQTAAPWSFTGSLGFFSLGGASATSRTFQVNPGTYTIAESVEQGWMIGNVACNPVAGVIVDLTHNNVQVTIGNGAGVTCTFQNEKLGQVTASAYSDLNRNLQRDNGEPLLDGWTFQLYQNPSTLLATRVTAEGSAVFPNLRPQVYTVCEVVKPHWIVLSPPAIDPAYGKPCRTFAVDPGASSTLLFADTPAR